MQTFKNRIHRWISPLSVAGLLTLGALCITSCQDEYDEKEELLNSNAVNFTMTLPEDWNLLSRAGAAQPAVNRFVGAPVNVGILPTGDTLQVSVFVEDRFSVKESLPKKDSVQSRATTADLANFGVYSYIKDNAETPTVKQFMIDQLVEKDGGEWTYSPIKYWPSNDYKLNFFGYSPHISAAGGVELNINKGADGSAPTIDYKVPTETAKQIDLLAASHDYISKNERTEDAVPLNFRHLLSEVKFRKGDLSGANITKLTISEIKSTGSNMLMLSDNSKQWTLGDDTATYSPGITVGSDNLIGSPMYLMPQSFTDDIAKINLSLQFPEDIAIAIEPDETYPKIYSISEPLSKFLTTTEAAIWEQGKSYTYKISTPQEVKVEINEDFTAGSNIKENVFFTNTGLAPINVRAALVGYWVVKRTIDGNEKDVIVHMWDPEDDGVFEGLPGTNWQKGKDGYYYYLQVLPTRGSTTEKLFTKYTLTATPPVVGAELILHVCVQASITDEDNSWASSKYQ